MRRVLWVSSVVFGIAVATLGMLAILPATSDTVFSVYFIARSLFDGSVKGVWKGTYEYDYDYDRVVPDRCSVDPSRGPLRTIVWFNTFDGSTVAMVASLDEGLDASSYRTRVSNKKIVMESLRTFPLILGRESCQLRFESDTIDGVIDGDVIRATGTQVWRRDDAASTSYVVKYTLILTQLAS